MSWDQKQRGQKRGYYYRSVRDGSRVRKVYLGRGERAEEAVREMDERRRARQAETELITQERLLVAHAETQLRELRVLVRTLVEATLQLAGYHFHRGQYRRYRYAMHGSGSDHSHT